MDLPEPMRSQQEDRKSWFDVPAPPGPSSGQAYADALGCVTGQIPGHELPGVADGTEYHDVQLTFPGHVTWVSSARER